MTILFTQLFQVTMTVLQGVNWMWVPAKYQPFITIGLALGQAWQGVLAHTYTPSGNKDPKGA